MGDVLLMVAVLVIFGIGYIFVGRFSALLEENQKKLEEESKESSCVMLSDDLSDEEILKEVKNFRERHEETIIFLYDSSEC